MYFYAFNSACMCACVYRFFIASPLLLTTSKSAAPLIAKSLTCIWQKCVCFFCFLFFIFMFSFSCFCLLWLASLIIIHRLLYIFSCIFSFFVDLLIAFCAIVCLVVGISLVMLGVSVVSYKCIENFL